MKRQETRFSYVYEDLKRRIVSGQFRPGSKLPSSRNLCEEYNVGIATITRALDALKTEGLIDIQIRRAPVVLSQDLQIPGISTILEQRDYILRHMNYYCLICLYSLHGIAPLRLCPIIGRLKKRRGPGLTLRAGKL